MKRLPTLFATAPPTVVSGGARASNAQGFYGTNSGWQGDVRDDMVQIVTKEAKAANVGL